MFAIVGLLSVKVPITAGERPNILILVADDLGWADVGFHGGRIKTSNLDALAHTGVVLEQHYVAPVAAPPAAA